MNEADRLAGYLHGRDAACPGCGYNLRGLRGTACPECGEGLTVQKIRYQRASPLTPSFFVGSAGLLAGGVLLLVAWSAAWRWAPSSRGEMTATDAKLGLMIASTLGLVASVAWWLDWSGEMTRRSAGFRWRWAAACWVWAGAGLVVGRLVGRW